MLWIVGVVWCVGWCELWRKERKRGEPEDYIPREKS